MGKLDGKVAIISGAGYGLGWGIGLRLGYEGAKVATIGRTESKIAAFQQEMESRGYNAMYMVGDVVRREDVNRFIKAVSDKWGHIDALVNNAMATNSRTIMETTDEDIDLVWNSSLRGSIYMMQACYPYFKKAGHGKVVNFGSIAAEFGNVNRLPYAIAKAAHAGLTRVAAAEWGKDNIQVNGISPAAAPLEAWEERIMKRPPELIEFSRTIWLAEKFAVDYETHIGTVVAFLCSDESNWITSRMIFVDGGQGSRR